MYDVGLEFADPSHEVMQRERVAEVWVAMNEASADAETQIALDAGQRTFDMLAARERIEIEANFMATRHLFAGEDGRFTWADAAIDGEAVVVSAAGLVNPKAVRYAWADNPACNLYNGAGLPAVPFRTDAPK